MTLPRFLAPAFLGLALSAGMTACGHSTSANLLVNGNAEGAAGSMNGAPVVTPGWTVTGEATAIEYGTTAYPQLGDPGPSDRGLNFFTGGQSDMVSTMTQVVDVSAHASAIDGGGVTYTLSGWLGGYSSQGDNVVVAAAFVNTAGVPTGRLGTIGPVTPADRANTTGLLHRSSSGPVPAGTRSIAVLVTMTRTDGSANDGYCDDLSLVLNGL